MHTEHSFKKSYFFRLNRCMHCNKINVLEPMYKCTGCSKVSHQSCFEKNQYTINERHRLEKRIIKDQKTLGKVEYNELGKFLEPNHLYNMLEKEKRLPFMLEKYLRARSAEHKSLFLTIRARALEPYTTEPMSRVFGQAQSEAVTGPEQSTNVFLSTQEIIAEALEPLVTVSEINLEEQERSSGSPGLGTEVLEVDAGAPEPAVAKALEPNAVASEPGAANPKLSKPVPELSVTKLEYSR